MSRALCPFTTHRVPGALVAVLAATLHGLYSRASHQHVGELVSTSAWPHCVCSVT
jgi:hypothetical protein